VGKPMTPGPNDLIQAFRLRFWRESPDNWRGKFFHEHLEISVANPEQAFELIRQALQWTPNNAGVDVGRSNASQGDEQDSTVVIKKSRPKLFWRLLTAWRERREEKP
jgi:hypothetical protein